MGSSALPQLPVGGHRTRNVRRKLGESDKNPAHIFAEPRVGYRMLKAERQEPPTPESPGTLAELAANAGRVLTYEHLGRRVWGRKGGDGVRPMGTVVSRLRRKLGDDADNPTFVFIEPGMGYWMPTGEMRGEGLDALGLQRHRGPGIWPQCENDAPGLT